VDPPIASAPWSPDFLAQELELLIVARAGEGLLAFRPVHAPSLQIGWGPGRTAEEVLTAALARYGLTPTILHSTSWRRAGDQVVLTYLAVVEAPDPVSPNLTAEPVTRSDLARGAATAAPAAIGVGQVLEHALRHLAWLLADDAAVAAGLPGWPELLAGYLPAPFRELPASA
jgi:hypothetical protein